MTAWQNKFLRHEDVSPDQLLANPFNHRIHTRLQQDHLKEILDEVGWVDFVKVNDNTGHIFDGHLRVTLALRHEQPTIPVAYYDLTEEEEKLVLATFDWITGEAIFDKATLADIADGLDKYNHLQVLKDVYVDVGVEFPGEELEDPGAQLDKAEELREKWEVESGQLWQLGEHQVICGDCTDEAVVERLMGGEKADMVFTDPPYNALKSWNKDEARGETRLDPSNWFANDNMEWEDYWQFIADSFCVLQGHSVYICCDYRIYSGIVEQFAQAGYIIKHCIVWKKNIWGLGKRYRFQHEFIVYATKTDDAPFYGGRDQSDVWEIDNDRQIDHNTPKPVGLPEKAINNSSQPDDLVMDMFLGSGTTLIACERLGRKARGIEIEPKYVAVTLERWHEMTGEHPKQLMEA